MTLDLPRLESLAAADRVERGYQEAAAETRVEKEPIGWIIDDPVVGEILVRDEAQAKSLQAGIVENYAEWQPSFAVYTRPQEATP